MIDRLNTFTKNSNEIKKEQKVSHDLFNLSGQEREVLKSKIEKSNGIIRVVVHPYYSRQKGSPDYENELSHPKQRIDIVEQGFVRILSAQQDTPVFLFEEYNEIFDTQKIISPILKQHNNEIYIVPTYAGFPEPYIPDSKDNERWDVLVDLLKSLGVKKVIIGGMYLWIDNHNDKQTLKGCVGGTMRQLSKHFDVQTSAMTHPISRKDLRAPDSKKGEIKNL